MAETVRLSVNGIERVIAAAPETPLLYALCNDLGYQRKRESMTRMSLPPGCPYSRTPADAATAA